jgi:hypothetical protein
MKKSLLAATALLAASVAGNANALATGFARVLQVDGIGASLGVVSFTALGVNGGFCDYLMDWGSPFNPNDVALCVVHELRTPFAPSCIINERADIISTVTAGDVGVCTGFNLKGEPQVAQLMLAEDYSGLAGIAVLGGCAIPTPYPITTLGGACGCAAAVAGCGC